MNELAERIKSLRTSRGVTQRALARSVGVDQADMSRIESGARRVSADVLARIAKQLGVEPGRLLGQSGHTTSLARLVKEYIDSDIAPGGLIELAEDSSIVEALQVTEDEFRTVASIALPPSVGRDGYVQLLMTVRAITKG